MRPKRSRTRSSVALNIEPLMVAILGGQHPNLGVIWEAPSVIKSCIGCDRPCKLMDERYGTCSPGDWSSTHAWDEYQWGSSE